MLKILNVEEFCENLPEVSSIKILSKNKFDPNGLYSEKIFGPLKSYTCECGTYFGKSREGEKCPVCKMVISSSSERRRRFAKIVLPMKVVNPIMYDLFINLAGNSVKEFLNKLMKDEKSFLCKDKDGLYVSNERPNDLSIKVWERTDAIFEFVKILALDVYAETKSPDWKMFLDNIDNFLINKIIVLPPELRPSTRAAIVENQIVDKINKYYMQLLIKKESLKSTIIDIINDKTLYYNYFRQFQKDIFELYEHIIEKFPKKEGLLRGNILGKRIDFSGRAVISADPSLNLDECVLPYFMVLELFKVQVAKRLLQLGRFGQLPRALNYIENCIDSKNYELYPICEEIIENEVCLLNRQPSLHRLSILGFKIKLSHDNVIKIHPLVCSPYNADFDGDQMAVYIPVSEKTKNEILEKFLPSKNLFHPANQDLTLTPSQDIVLGVYLLTNNKINKLNEKVNFKGVEITKGRELFNRCLPEDYEVINEVVDKNKLLDLLNKIKNSYSSDVTSKVLDNIKDMGFKYATLYGSTISLDLINLSSNELNFLRDSIYSEEEISKQVMNVSRKDIENIVKDNCDFSYLIYSGARGKWDQARQVLLTRGFISNFEGKILKEPVKNSLLDGLTEREFFISTYGCRKGLLDVAINTGTSGYQSRKLIFTAINLMKDKSPSDCGTTDYLKIKIENKKQAEMLIGRFYSDGKILIEITNENYKEIIKKKINLRSPIYCQNEKICDKCYGRLHEKLHSPFIGVIAAQSLGEINTQLILRVFHTSGVAVMHEENSNMMQTDIIDNLSQVSKLLHIKTPEKVHENLPLFVSKLFNIYNSSKDINFIHIECIVAQLMWVGRIKWRLHPNRNKIKPIFYSIQSVPEKESWAVGFGFSNPKKSMLDGLKENEYNYYGKYDQMVFGENVCNE